VRTRRSYLQREAGQEPSTAGRISAARIKTLQHIGLEQFAALRRFVKKHGHARMPCQFANDLLLGTWIHDERRTHVAEFGARGRPRALSQPPHHCDSHHCDSHQEAAARRLGVLTAGQVGRALCGAAALRQEDHGHATARQRAGVKNQRQVHAAELQREAGRELRRGTRRITAVRHKKLQRIGFEKNPGAPGSSRRTATSEGWASGSTPSSRHARWSWSARRATLVAAIASLRRA
jgi:hypothetical protein